MEGLQRIFIILAEGQLQTAADDGRLPDLVLRFSLIVRSIVPGPVIIVGSVIAAAVTAGSRRIDPALGAGGVQDAVCPGSGSSLPGRSLSGFILPRSTVLVLVRVIAAGLIVPGGSLARSAGRGVCRV